MKGKITKAIVRFALALFVATLCAMTSHVETALAADSASIAYDAHVQNLGWMNPVADGETAGTEGRALRLEAVWMRLDSTIEGSVNYQVHVANEGTHDWTPEGAVAGTTGKSLAIESIRIKLDGPIARSYDVQYRAHVANIGWMDWVQNGEMAGTEGQARAMEAVQVRLVEKGTDGEDPSQDSSAEPSASVRAHSQNVGWQAWVGDGEVAGTTGQALRLEALRISIGDTDGSVSYQTHVACEGWQDWVSDGEIAGTTGRGHAIEGIRIRLGGNVATNHDVLYRVHVANLGWLGWTSNGELAGSEGISLPVEAVQVRIVPKNTEHPSETASVGMPTLEARAHCQNLGWIDWAGDGDVIGTTGRSLRLEAVELSLKGLEGVGGGIAMRSHVSNIGWMDWVNDGTSGTTGQGQAIEAVQISLTGNAGILFDVWYRVHSQDKGWLGWAKNGEVAGTTGGGLRGEAIQVHILPKGTSFDRGGDAYVDASRSVSLRIAPHMSHSTCQRSYASSNFRQNGCCATSYAICLSCVTGRDFDPTSFFYNGFARYDAGHIAWRGSFDMGRLYGELQAGHPSMLHYYYADGGEHWVACIGIRDGANPNALGYGDLIVIDPYTGSETYLTSSCKFYAPNGVSEMIVIA